MPKSTKTYLFCYDDHRSFADNVRKRFSDTSRYKVFVFHNLDDLVNQLVAEKEHASCKVAVLGVQDSGDNYEVIDHLTVKIKKIDSSIGIILLGPPDKIDGIKKVIRINIDSYIPFNANQILRIHNTVKKLQSEHSLLIYRRRRNFSFYFLLAFIAVSVLLVVIAYFRFPQYF
jgi:hypothetical protein